MTTPEVAMLVLQVVCCGEAAYRGLGWKALYWAGAFVLTLAVVKGIKT